MVELMVRLGEKGQLVIPKIFRDHYKLYPKETVTITANDEGVLITNNKKDLLKTMEKIAEIASMKRKGKPFIYNKEEFYEQHEERTRRAGIKI